MKQPTSPQPQQPLQQPVKKPSTKPSITGGVFSLLALISAAIAQFLIRLEFKPDTESTTLSEKAGEAVAAGTTKVLGAIFGMPFIVGAVLFAVIAIVFTVIRLGKVKAIGLAISVLWIALSVWAIVIASGALELIKAQPAQ